MAAMIFARKPKKLPSLSSAELGRRDIVAGLCIADKTFRSCAYPFHRPAGELRPSEHQRHLVIDRRFHAETAADIAETTRNSLLSGTFST